MGNYDILTISTPTTEVSDTSTEFTFRRVGCDGAVTIRVKILSFFIDRLASINQRQEVVV